MGHKTGPFRIEPKCELVNFSNNFTNFIKLEPTLTNFSESPRHLLTILDAEILKNVVSHSVATAFAKRVFPVP